MWNIIIFELAGTFLLVYGSLSCEFNKNNNLYLLEERAMVLP
jgi:hypothetical protein